MVALLCNGDFQALHFLVLFEELVEQHRVHLIVAHTVGFPLLVAHHQVRINLFYFFGYKTKLRYACRIDLLFVMEGDRFQRKKCFAGLLHWLNFVFKPSGGGNRAKFVICVNEHATSSYTSSVEDLTDIATVAGVCTDGANTNHAIGRHDVDTSSVAHSDIVAAVGVVHERLSTDGCVAAATNVGLHHLLADGR